MIHDAASKKLLAEAASRQAAKIGVIASPFLVAAQPNSNSKVFAAMCILPWLLRYQDGDNTPTSIGNVGHRDTKRQYK
jgi:hypothetical protein